FSPGLRRGVAVRTTRRGSGPLQGGGSPGFPAAAGGVFAAAGGGGAGLEQLERAGSASIASVATVPRFDANSAYPQHIARMFGGRSLPAKGRAAQGRGARRDLFAAGDCRRIRERARRRRGAPPPLNSDHLDLSCWHG